MPRKRDRVAVFDLDEREGASMNLTEPEARICLPGLEGSVEVYRDSWGIAHIRARGTADAFFAQGFAHAQDRLWQMDAVRRRMLGRWAEWIGPSAIPADILARRLRVAEASQRDLAALSSSTR